MPDKGFRQLEVWQLSMTLVEGCYRITALLPSQERYGLISQTRRAAVSIAANIAEGHNRRLAKPKRNHVSIALGSQAELETLLELVVRLGFLPAESLLEINHQVRRVGQMLHGLHRSIKTDQGDDN